MERQVELQGMLDAWNAPDANHAERKGPFDKVEITGAEVFWLAERSGPVEYDPLPGADLTLPNLHLEGASLRVAHLEQADVGGAHLETLYVNTPLCGSVA
jgi:hypothetical protein